MHSSHEASSFLSYEGCGPKNASVTLHPLQGWKVMLFKTSCSIRNEHCHYTQQNQPDKSAFAEHSGHYNLLNDKNIVPEILAQAPFHMGSKRQSCIPSAQTQRAVLPKQNVEAYHMLLDGKQAEGSLTRQEGFVS